MEEQEDLEGRLKGGPRPKDAQRGCVGPKRVESGVELGHGALCPTMWAVAFQWEPVARQDVL